MTALTRTLIVAEMQARELARRRTALALLVLLPAAFYFSVPASEAWGVLSGAIGVAWAVAAAGMFAVQGWRRTDPRLLLAGARPAHGLVGRLMLVSTLALGLVGLFAPLLLSRSGRHIDDAGVLVLALAVMAANSVVAGLAIGALVPRELEGTLVLIGLVGVAMSVPPETVLAKALPLWGPIALINVATGRMPSATPEALVHFTGSLFVLLAVGSWAWHRRVRIHRKVPQWQP